MRRVSIVAAVAAAAIVGGCDKEMTTAQKGAVGGAALGTGIGLATQGSFGQVVGAGLIGGAVGYLGGTLIDSNKK